MSDTKNHWELYSSMEGWEAVSERLDAALATAIVNLDAAVGGGATIKDAVEAAFLEVARTMGLRENADFGAGDSEPYYHLSRTLTKHIRSKFGVADDVRIDRYGDVEGMDAPRFGR